MTFSFDVFRMDSESLLLDPRSSELESLLPHSPLVVVLLLLVLLLLVVLLLPFRSPSASLASLSTKGCSACPNLDAPVIRNRCMGATIFETFSSSAHG